LIGIVLSLIGKVLSLIRKVQSLIGKVQSLIRIVQSLIGKVQSLIRIVQSLIGKVQSLIRKVLGLTRAIKKRLELKPQSRSERRGIVVLWPHPLIHSPKERGRCVTVGGEDFILYIYNICIFVKKKFKRVRFAGEKTPAKASFLQNLNSSNGTPTRAKTSFIIYYNRSGI
jgi:hypothetical protein